MTGTQVSECLGNGWMDAVHPDDRAPCQEKWEKCMRSGETFEIEYRLHDATHGYRWFLDRPSPCATIGESSCNGLEPAPTLRSRSTTSRSLTSRLRSVRKNWPTQIPACS